MSKRTFDEEMIDRMVKERNIFKINDEQYYRRGVEDAAKLFADVFLEELRNRRL